MSEKNPFITQDNENVEVETPKFSLENEEYIRILEKSVREKAQYDLRQMIGIADRIRAKAYTGKLNEYGEQIEDWSKVSTDEMINSLAEANAWNFFSTPVRMNAFIESSLADLIYKDEYNKALSSPDLTGTAGVKIAVAELAAQEAQFVAEYRKMYQKYVEETAKSFELFVKRLESIVWMKQKEEAVRSTRGFDGSNPFA